MNIKQPGYPVQILALNIVGSVTGSIVLIVFMIAVCAVCRRKESKNDDEDRNGNDRNARTSTSVQIDSEYQIPVVNARTSGEVQGDLEVYTVPKPNTIYSDLDKRALNSAVTTGTKPTSTPTEYAVIDYTKTTTTKQNVERHYANVSNISAQESNVYANLNDR